MTGSDDILTPKHAKANCIKGNKRCRFLYAKQLMDIEGKMFYVYYCSCEDEMCAGCIPMFVTDLLEKV